MAYKFRIEQGDLGNGFQLMRDLEGVYSVIPGGSMGASTHYRLRIAECDFEASGYDDNKCLKSLKDQLVSAYQYFENAQQKLFPEHEELRRELSDLLKAVPQ